MLHTFLWACLGALFPEIVRQFELRNQNVGVPFGYFIRSLLFVLASGAIVLAFPGPISPQMAIYAGAAAPALVSAGARTIAKTRGSKAGDSDVSSDEPGPDEVWGSESDDKHVRVRNNVIMKASGWRRFFDAL